MATAELSYTAHIQGMDSGAMSDLSVPLHDAFISYSHEDKDWVDRVLLPCLKGVGLRVFIDTRQIESGGDIQIEIAEALEASRRIILVMSPEYFKSRWTRFEWSIGIALQMNGPEAKESRLLLLKYREVRPHPSLLRLKYIDCTDEARIDNYLKEVLREFDLAALDVVNPESLVCPIGDKPAREVARDAHEGMNALVGLVQDRPTVCVDLIGFEPAFEVATDLIEAIGRYKSFHEQLHELKGICDSMAPMSVAVRIVTSLWDSLQMMRAKIKAILDTLVAQTDPAQGDILPAARLNRLGTTLQEAIRDRRADEFGKVLGDLTGLINRGLGNLNNRLVAKAEALEQSALVVLLTRVGEILDRHNLDAGSAPQVQTFRASLESLDRLMQRLGQDVANHNSLQAIDYELQVVAPLLADGVAADSAASRSELELMWPEVTSKLDGLVGDSTWIPGLQVYGATLGAVLARSDPTELGEAFRNFSSQLNQSFVRADRDLLTLCGDLRVVGQPLAVMSRIIRHG